MAGVRVHPRRIVQVLGGVVLLVLLAGVQVLRTGSQVQCPGVIFEEQSGMATGLYMRKLPHKKERYQLEKVGLNPQPYAPWGHNIKMVSEDNNTHHLWYWPETYDILQQCQKKDWYSAGKLPNVSVIINFIDKENVSTLLHTVHSIVQRTPRELLQEVILIADNSHSDDLGETLDIYINTVFTNVRLYRSHETLGLIRGRLKGIRMAKGEVVVCMDSHMEVQPGWLEPLLYEIVKNPKTLAASVLDWMRKDEEGRWEYKHAGSYWKTYFDWTMVFGFQTMSDTAIQARKSLTEPVNSPVTVGTIFAINKSWFTEIGEFDEGMQLWGGENLDLPIRIWLCGGRVINVPCSRAAHLEYEHNRDYRNKWDSIIHRNYKRFALVWMDDYIKYLYQYFPHLKKEDVGEVSHRMYLKDKCPHNFEWYLKNVFPELGLPEEQGLGYGGLMNTGSKRCLDTLFTTKPGLESCDRAPSLSNFYWSEDSELRFPMHVFNAVSRVEDGHRLDELRQDEYLSNYKHQKTSKWVHWKNGHFIETRRKLCLEAIPPKKIFLTACDPNKDTQKWTFKHYSKNYEAMVNGHSEELSHITKVLKYWRDDVLKIR